MTRPMLTQREAAAACGVSRTTIRRRREAGDLPGAYEDARRGWMVPVDDLLAAGFRLNAPLPADAPPSAPAPARGVPVGDDGQDVAVLRAELARVHAEHTLALARAEHAQELAEAEAEHLRRELSARGAHIADLQRAVAALSPAPERGVLTPPPGGPTVPGQSHGELARQQQAGAEPRRRWWGGRS
ncbi:helix-turn-helix transcriptional regulator [Streptomyces chryseus]|nr:helix-turn-helix domain-containing protein [Streptomyces chryseus]